MQTILNSYTIPSKKVPTSNVVCKKFIHLLNKFKQCFLTDISVNYTAEGVYATYEGREPVSMIMDLTDLLVPMI